MTTHRKLAAILSADAAGYSRLMADDEAETLRALNDSRALFRKRIEAHGGRLIDTAGDSILAEFPSAVEAVDCAVEIQHELAKRNAQLAEHRRMQFRIGINLGDVIAQEDGTIYGDGVNVAARLQTLSERGGVCISGTAFDQVEGKLPLAFKFIGEQQVKNIAKPVRAYRVLNGVVIGSARQTGTSKRPRLAIGATAVITLLVALAIVWKFQGSATQRDSSADPAIAMPTGPSIAVLPFTNMSGDPKEDYLSDGLTEDIITILSKLPQIVVIARTSTFVYKGKAVDVRNVGRDLGVRYVLEGSVRRSDNQIRITAQLIDTTNGNHLWAERYDRPLKDLFALQDEITQKIVTELDVKLSVGEQARAWRRTTHNLEAYDYHLRGYKHLQSLTKEDLALAKQYFEKAISLDPAFASAYAKLGFVYLMNVVVGFSGSPSSDLDRAFELANRAITLDDSQGLAHILLGRVYLQKRQHDQALAFGKKAVELEPSGAVTHAVYAHILEASGQPNEALTQLQRAMRLGPAPEPWWPWLQSLCLKQLGRYDEAIAAMKRSIALSPGALYPHVFLVDIYVVAGRQDEALAESREVSRLYPTFSVDAFLAGFDIYRDPKMIPAYAANLHKAGLK
ncbi:MAG: adenylate/guanylate cyclase domain-containing protein [Pseudomonadota bacterium]